jgi:hypothetical protein
MLNGQANCGQGNGGAERQYSSIPVPPTSDLRPPTSDLRPSLRFPLRRIRIFAVAALVLVGRDAVED